MAILSVVKNLALSAIGVCAVLGSVNTAQAALITSGASLSSTKVVDFSQFSDYFTFTSGPVEVGGLVGESIQWSSSTPSSVIGTGGYGLASNNYWDEGRGGYTGLNQGYGGSMVFTFVNELKSAVGGFINYAPGNGSPILIEALGDNGNVLESYDLETLAPIFTPFAANDGAFRAIQRATADIRALRVSNSYVVLDNLTFSNSNATAVPTPALLPGLIGLGVGVLRKRKAEAAKQAVEV